MHKSSAAFSKCFMNSEMALQHQYFKRATTDHLKLFLEKKKCMFKSAIFFSANFILHFQWVWARTEVHSLPLLGIQIVTIDVEQYISSACFLKTCLVIIQKHNEYRATTGLHELLVLQDCDYFLLSCEYFLFYTSNSTTPCLFQSLMNTHIPTL